MHWVEGLVFCHCYCVQDVYLEWMRRERGEKDKKKFGKTKQVSSISKLLTSRSSKSTFVEALRKVFSLLLWITLTSAREVRHPCAADA